jgi:hypothetical protein
LPLVGQDLAAADAPVLSDEYEMGKSAAEIDSEAASIISGH